MSRTPSVFCIVLFCWIVAPLFSACGPGGGDDDHVDDDSNLVDDDSVLPDDDSLLPDDDTIGPDDDSAAADDDTALPDDDTALPDDDSAPTDADGDGHAVDVDCDDSDPTIHPGAPEVCDAVDQDCDGLLDDCPLEGILDLSVVAGARIHSTEGDAGYSLAGAGDFNGDGYDDIILGNPFGTVYGLAHVFFGPVVGNLDVSAADVRLECDNGELGAQFGWSVGGGGDVNGDGYDDVVVGAPGYYEGVDGRAYVFFGPLSGTTLSSSADSRLIPPHVDGMGFGVALVQDVTGDALDDLWVSMVAYSYASESTVYLFAGPLDVTLHETDAVGTVTPGADDITGHLVAGASDVDGDGVRDLLFGGFYTGAKVIGGDISGAITGDDALATLWAEPAGVGGYSLLSVAGPGDVDGDGVGDVLMGDYSYSDAYASQGAAYLFLGPVAGDLDASAADLILAGETESSHAGLAVGAPGDVDGDGLDDFLVGAPLNSIGPDTRGSVYLVYGPGPAGSHSLADADVRFDSPSDAVGAGWAAVGAGDVDADGYDDFIVSALGSAASPIDSTVFVVYGRPR